jgi:hypothetical protein
MDTKNTVSYARFPLVLCCLYCAVQGASTNQCHHHQRYVAHAHSSVQKGLPKQVQPQSTQSSPSGKDSNANSSSRHPWPLRHGRRCVPWAGQALLVATSKEAAWTEHGARQLSMSTAVTAESDSAQLVHDQQRNLTDKSAHVCLSVCLRMCVFPPVQMV